MSDGSGTELVDCARMTARLTLSGCQSRWAKAQDLKPHQIQISSLSHCHTCPVGAVRSGQGAATARAVAAAAALASICPRCERAAPRQIHGRLCVSCYNRDREARLGRNAKGVRPGICDVIHLEAIAAARNGPAGAAHVEMVDRVVSRVEAIVVLARRGLGVFAAPALPRPVGWQLELAI